MRILLSTLIICLLAGCDRTAGNESLELRQYTVPAEKTSAIVNTLNGVLAGTEHQPGIGRASSDVEGTVVVLAPARIQASIEKTVTSLGAAHAGTGSGSVRLDYWVVSAVPGPGPDDPALAPVRSALDAARPALGDVHFEGFGQTSLVSSLQPLSDSNARGALTVQQEVRSSAVGVYARIAVLRHAPTPADENLSIEIDADLPFGETVVLAQQGAGGDARGVRRLVLVRAEPLGAK